jgi:hypothetical protein
MFVGIDWASERHAVCVLDDAGTKHTSFQIGQNFPYHGCALPTELGGANLFLQLTPILG